jgi:diguanylate cyclase (GGDEF)-like protein/PAS domain S-box-containing protein
MWSVVVFAVGVSLTLAGATFVRDQARETARKRFEDSATQTSAAIQSQLNGYFTLLNSVGANITSQENPPSTEEVTRYVERAKVFEQYPSIVGILYLSRVPGDRLDAFVKAMQASHPGFVLFQFGDVPAGAPHYVLSYYVPGSIDLQFPSGADVSAIPSLVSVMGAAGADGSVVAGSFQSDPFLQKIAKATNFKSIDTLLSMDFFIGVPAYDTAVTGNRPTTPPAGWVAAPIAKFEGVLRTALEGQPRELGSRLTVDLTKADLTSTKVISRVAERDGTAGDISHASFHTAERFTIRGVPWSLTLWAGPDAGKAPATVLIVLLSGLAATLLVTVLTYFRIIGRSRERAYAAELADREQFQRDVLDSVTDGMVVLDRKGTVVDANPAWSDLLGEERDGRGVGSPYEDLVTAHVRDGSSRLSDAVRSVLAGEQTAEVDLPVERPGGRRWYAARFTPLRSRRGGAVVVHSDITERMRSHAELEMKATRDTLTGLLNRLAIEEEVERVLGHARAQEAFVALLFLDLDGFKPINDTYGHAVGDEVLRAVARRITAAVRTSDRVARLGGDEFVVLIGPLPEPTAAEHTAERILRSFENPIEAGRNRIDVGLSIGIALVDAPLAGSADSLLEAADRAMYAAKQAGGRTYTVAR